MPAPKPIVLEGGLVRWDEEFKVGDTWLRRALEQLPSTYSIPWESNAYMYHRHDYGKVRITIEVLEGAKNA